MLSSLVFFVFQQSFFYTLMMFLSIHKSFFHEHLLFKGLDDILSRLQQVEWRPSRAVPPLGDTSDTSRDESDMGEPRRRMRSKRTTKWRKRWGPVICVGFCDLRHRCFDKAQPILWPYLLQGRLGNDSWSLWNFASLHGQQASSTRPTSEVGDAMLGSVWFWWKAMSPQKWATAGKNNEGSFGRERHGVPFFRGRHCRKDWCNGPESWDYGQCFFPHWSAASGRKMVYQLWAQFTLSAVRVNVDVTQSRDEVWCCISICAVLST